MYSCGDADAKMQQLLRFLADKRVLMGPHSARASSYVALCGSCGAAGHRTDCTGWTLVVPPESPIVLGHFQLEGRIVDVHLSSNLDFRRPTSQSTEEWQQTPAAAATLAFDVWDISRDPVPWSQQFVELRAEGVPGLVWDLSPARDSRFVSKGMTWSAPPMDVVLAVDSVLYQLSPLIWRSLQRAGAYKQLVIQSEELIQRSWFEQMSGLFASPASRRETVLRRLDNTRMPGWEPQWNPRPRAAL